MAMRMLHVVESLEPEAGSVAIHLRGLLKALDTRGIESATLAADGGEEVTSGEGGANLDMGRIARFVQEAAVVHIHGWGRPLARRVAAAAQKAGRPYLIAPVGGLSEGTYHRRNWRDKLRGLLGERRLIRRAAGLIALNALEQKDLRSRNLNADTRVLPYGLDFDAYESLATGRADLPAAPAGRAMLMLGPIHPVEGVVPLMKAFAEVGPDADDWSLVLAGPETGDWRKMLEAAVHRKGAADRVVFAPAPNPETQRAWLARASVVATPSLHFRCGVSILQALAAGIMVIASPQAVPDGVGEAARICAPKREELREALRFVLRQADEDRAALAQATRRKARASFDWSVLADRYVELYRGFA